MDSIFDAMQGMTDSELFHYMEQHMENPTHKSWEIAIDWFGEAKLRELGLMDDC